MVTPVGWGSPRTASCWFPLQLGITTNWGQNAWDGWSPAVYARRGLVSFSVLTLWQRLVLCGLLVDWLRWWRTVRPGDRAVTLAPHSRHSARSHITRSHITRHCFLTLQEPLPLPLLQGNVEWNLLCPQYQSPLHLSWRRLLAMGGYSFRRTVSESWCRDWVYTPPSLTYNWSVFCSAHKADDHMSYNEGLDSSRLGHWERK